MSVVKRILCLANSRKMSGRCVAGREVLANAPGPWIRPVSARKNEEVSNNERQYSNDDEPHVLDIIDIPLTKHKPHACQTENWLLDPDETWMKVGQIGWAELQPYVENPPTLWMNTRSTIYGENDEILQKDADKLSNSLVLIYIPTLELRVFALPEDWKGTKRRVQACFQYHGIRYALCVTDPVIEDDYKKRDDGMYRLGECCLCVSLGEPFKKNNGEPCRYKLVAAVISREAVRP